MKRYVKYAFIVLIIGGIFGFGCGSENKKSPYDAPSGTTITGGGTVDIDSFGGGYVTTFWLYVSEGGEPLNDIDVAAVFFLRPDVSNWATNLKPVNFVDPERVKYWDDDGMPHFVTDKHGSLVVDIYIPFGYSGEMDVVFDIGVNTTEANITVNPAGVECFDGQDNDGDGGIDPWDPECVSPFDLNEAASTA